MSHAMAEIIDVLTEYFDGLYYSDTQRLKRVFHPRAQYVYAIDGNLVCLTMEQYFPIVDARPSPSSRAEQRADRVISIEMAGPVTAFSRVECTIGPKHFTDFLSLIHIGGRWQIIAKVYHFDLQ
jgi:putative lumazine-binding protein